MRCRRMMFPPNIWIKISAHAEVASETF